MGAGEDSGEGVGGVEEWGVTGCRRRTGAATPRLSIDRDDLRCGRDR
jgi:hypothetical protein